MMWKCGPIDEAFIIVHSPFIVKIIFPVLSSDKGEKVGQEYVPPSGFPQNAD